MFMDCSFIIYLTHWRCISMCSKRLIYFNVPTWSKLLFAVFKSLLCHISFPASIRLMICSLKNCPINSFKISQGKPELPTTIINIITSQPRGPYLPLSRGGRLVALVGVCIVWNLEPLASGGQSSPKLIPHIICQFLCARGKNSERGLILQGIKCQPAPFSHVWK